MNISEKLTQEQLQQLLLEIYKKGHESSYTNVTEAINEIRENILYICSQT